MIETPLTAIQEAHNAEPHQVEDAVAWLAHYGYLAGSILSGAFTPFLALTNLAAAIMEMQRVAGLPQTGILDDATKAKMSEPRCGCLDVQRMVEFARWRKNRLTYAVQSYLPESMLSKADQVSILDQAWKAWEAHADIKLTPVSSGTPDIIISTGRGRADGFDGPSGTLAWAQLPNQDRQLLMKFDLDDTFGIDRNIRLLNVGTHEFGHLLGLDHSGVSSALMAPYYSAGVSRPQPSDDIPRIQALYGPAAAHPAPTPTPTPGPNQDRVAVYVKGKYYRAALIETPN